MIERLAIALAAAVLFACAGSGGSTESRGERTEPLRREDTRVVALRAKVAAIDHTKRLVTIRSASGEEATFYADEGVQNLQQVKVGDELVGELGESVVLELREPTPEEREAGASLFEVLATAEPGEKPAGVFVRQIRAVLTVDAIDEAAGTATLRGPAGNTRTIAARDRRNLSRVKIGDTVVATYTESLRLEVARPGAP